VKKSTAFLRNPKIHYLVHKSLSVHNILIQYNYDKYNSNKQNITYCYCIVIIVFRQIIVIYWNYVFTIIFMQYKFDKYNSNRDTQWRSWLSHCAKSRKLAGSIPDGVIGMFLLTYSFWPHYGLGVDSDCNRYEEEGYLLGGKSGRCVVLATLPPSCAEYLEILGASNVWSSKGLKRPVT